MTFRIRYGEGQVTVRGRWRSGYGTVTVTVRIRYGEGQVTVQ
jgi:hypothetical protein